MKTKRSPNVWRSLASVVMQFLLIVTLSASAWNQTPAGEKYPKHNSADANAVARGKYIVEGVAMCTQCHTPRTNSGALDTTRWLQGAPLWLNPAKPVSDWPLKAPRL